MVVKMAPWWMGQTEWTTFLKQGNHTDYGSLQAAAVPISKVVRLAVQLQQLKAHQPIFWATPRQTPCIRFPCSVA